jgi:hypothetical protein
MLARFMATDRAFAKSRRSSHAGEKKKKHRPNASRTVPRSRVRSAASRRYLRQLSVAGRSWKLDAPIASKRLAAKLPITALMRLPSPVLSSPV